MKRICHILLLINSFIYGQQRVLEIDINGLRSKKATVDSVQLQGNKLIKLTSYKNDYLLPVSLMEYPSPVSLYIYNGCKKYIIKLDADAFNNCSNRSISLYYFKRNLYYKLQDCTSIQITGPVNTEKIKRIH